MSNTQEEFSHFFKLELDLFDGPIDLLLHLVKSHELEIEKISLSQVTGQYLACLEMMKSIDLEVAGEYLVIAATLLSIKSSFLLEEPVELVPDEDGNLIDPHEELLRKLREAEVYKEGAYELSCKDFLNIDVFAPKSSLKKVKPLPVEFDNHDPILLGKAFRKLLAKTDSKENLYTITLEAVSIVDSMMSVLDRLGKSEKPIVFYELIPDMNSRGSIIGTFIALLELCKRQAIIVKQDHAEDEIQICLSESGDKIEDMSSEFDDTLPTDNLTANA